MAARVSTWGHRETDKAETDHSQGGHNQHHRLAGELVDDIFIEVVFRSGTGDNHTGGHRDKEGGHLGHKAVAHGGGGVDLHDLPKGTHMIQEAHDDAPHQVDEGGDDRHDRVALDELGSTVHGAEKVGFPLDFRAAGARLLFVDQAGAEVGVDRHLFAGHRVQGKGGRNLGNTLGPFGDDDKVDCQQRQ